jgi:hypothetical protein
MPGDPVPIDLHHHQPVRRVQAVAAARIGGKRRLPVGRGRHEANLVESSVERHRSEEVADRTRTGYPHPFGRHGHDRVIRQEPHERRDVDRFPRSHEPFHEDSLVVGRRERARPWTFNTGARPLQGTRHRAHGVAQRLRRLLCGPTQDVAQNQNGPLLRR